MLRKSDLHPYQRKGVLHQLQHPQNFLWMSPGLGKTATTLTTIDHLLTQSVIHKVLLLGPLRVVQSVWQAEAWKWAHLRNLKFSLVHGDPVQRMGALAKDAHIYMTNYENLAWLSHQLQHYYLNRGIPLPFDFLVVDEVSKMKSVATIRMKAILPLLESFPWRTGLTGTPASNSLQDVFGQALVIDSGQRLGRDYGGFINAYFKQADRNGYKYVATPEGEAFIYTHLSDITLDMQAEDYLDVPDLIIEDIYVDLSPRHRKQYDELERSLFTELDDGTTLEVLFAAGKVNKCLQFSNGNVIVDSDSGEWKPVHDRKLEVLDDLLEELGGEPLLLLYAYRMDAQRILEEYPYARNITGMSRAEFLDTMAAWQRGEIRLLLGHPASMGHGVDGLQARGNNICWYGLNWSLELYMQAVARIHRQGQTRPVVCHRILGRDTFDEMVKLTLETKDRIQKALRAEVAKLAKTKILKPAEVIGLRASATAKLEAQEAQELQEHLTAYRQGRNL